ILKDQILIFSTTWAECVNHVQLLLERFQRAGQTVNPIKCALEKSETCHLGHIISDKQVKPKVGKVQAVLECPQPHTKVQVQSTLGLTGYYQKFIPHYASIVAPLTDLTKK
uniref:Reverse transcriptase/retrotransposon-derived protein RNase H-like domain-containing protein n=1 Tax=Latimeria chalumnae TaxID=7897 RepID=H3AIQ2_LATCH